jgi:hypothetical protein
MRIFRFLIVCGTLCALLLAAAPAEAHTGAALRTVETRIGPYPMRIAYYNEPRGGQALAFSIEPLTDAPSNLRYTVTAIPGTTVDAVPVKARLASAADHRNGVEGSVNLPVSGQWLLTIEVVGPQGLSSEDVPVLAGAPPAIPQWLGWLIGLTPVWAMLVFVIVQARRATRRSLALTETARM